MLFTTFCVSSFWQQKSPGSAALGGHAVAAVGYDDAKQALRLRNSWGSSWNGDGHTWFPYIEWGAQWEAWSSLDQKGSRAPPKPAPPVADASGCCCPAKK